MKSYVLRAVAGALLLTACEDQSAAPSDDEATMRPATDSTEDEPSTELVADASASGTRRSGSATDSATDSGRRRPDATTSPGTVQDSGGVSAMEPRTADAATLVRDAGANPVGSSAADSSVGSCVKGQTKGSEVVVIGDSFIAINHAITNQIQTKARATGALAQSDRYRDLSVSGTTLANNQIPGQYVSAVRTGPVKVVLMNGGGNDCLQRNDGAGALTSATTLLESMGQNETEHVVYFFYPDPAGLLGGGSLKSCLDALRPQIQSLCAKLAKPKCHFIDLRSIWQPSYAMGDGIHPTQQGGAAVGDAVWRTMQEQCIAQ